jgi:hypothetical protein
VVGWRAVWKDALMVAMKVLTSVLWKDYMTVEMKVCEKVVQLVVK